MTQHPRESVRLAWMLTWHDMSSNSFPSSTIVCFSWENLNITLSIGAQLSTINDRRCPFTKLQYFTKTYQSPTIGCRRSEIYVDELKTSPNFVDPQPSDVNGLKCKFIEVLHFSKLVDLRPSSINDLCWQTSTLRNFDKIP
jgi:hypothetical protein